MKFITSFCFFFILFGFAQSHTYLSSIIINGVTLPEGDCLRPQIKGSEGYLIGVYRHYPINDVSMFPQGLLGPNMTCGFQPFASRPANKKCALQAGSEIGLQYYQDGPSSTDPIVAASHEGPVIVYLAKSDTGAGNVWFKIYEDGYDPASRKWAVDRLIANRGKFTFKLPSDISPGNYLLRSEVIALHDGDKPHGSQPYVSCIELTISGSGTANPPGVAFPGAYKESDPGIAFNLYSGYNSYPIPGPALYVSSPTTGVQTSSPRTTGVQTTGVQTSSPRTTGVQTSSPRTTGVQTTGVQTSSPRTTGVQTSSPRTSSVQSTGVQTSSPRTTGVQSTGVQTSGPRSTTSGSTGIDGSTSSISTTATVQATSGSRSITSGSNLLNSTDVVSGSSSMYPVLSVFLIVTIIASLF